MHVWKPLRVLICATLPHTRSHLCAKTVHGSAATTGDENENNNNNNADRLRSHFDGQDYIYSTDVAFIRNWTISRLPQSCMLRMLVNENDLYFWSFA